MHVRRGRVARELARLEEQMGRAFERAFAESVGFAPVGDAWRPPIDVYENDKSTIVRVELAGVKSDDLRIVVDGEYLQVSGRRELARAGEPQHHLVMEIAQGTFDRIVRVPAPYDPDRARSHIEAGILTIELPRLSANLRRISVRTS